MSGNFDIFVHRNSDNLHLKLSGDFDGSSACELISLLEEQSDAANRVIIHTSGLGTVHSFGCELFQRHMRRVHSISGKILLTGENSSHLNYRE